jgi:glutamine amidotransferase
LTVALIDLGCGNLGSVAIAIERLGIPMTITVDAAEIAAADRVILPGVGAAGYAMRRIEELGLREPIRALTRPVLIPGAVRKLDPAPGRPVPHMGWSKLSVSGDALGLATGDYVYFANSYAADPGPHVRASADYGGEIPAVVQAGNFTGVQFHPERSGAAGSRLLRSFVGAP